MAELDSAIRIGLTVTLDDMPADEFAGLQILHAEREEFQQEQQEQQ